jgi:K+-sensing histidine kinase KdpD
MTRKERDYLFKAIHDMRTPLQAIMGYSGLILRKAGNDLPEQQRENLERIVLSAQRLTSIVDQMVEKVKIKSSNP